MEIGPILILVVSSASMTRMISKRIIEVVILTEQEAAERKQAPRHGRSQSVDV